MLIVAALLMAALGIAHSILGERYIIAWLVKREDLPPVLGSTEYAGRTIRFAWHVTSVLALGVAIVLAQLAWGASDTTVIGTIGWTLIACGLLPLFYTRGRHPSWIVFFGAGSLCLLSATGFI